MIVAEGNSPSISMKKILFVCSGNTCRSPIAEGYFNFLARKTQLDGELRAASAGVHAYDGSPSTTEAQKVCAEAGFDISGHRSQQLTEALVKEATLILAMTQAHKKEVTLAFPSAKGKLFTLKEFAGQAGDIQDPIGLSTQAYQKVFQEIRQAVEKILPEIK